MKQYFISLLLILGLSGCPKLSANSGALEPAKCRLTVYVIAISDAAISRQFGAVEKDWRMSLEKSRKAAGDIVSGRVTDPEITLNEILTKTFVPKDGADFQLKRPVKELTSPFDPEISEIKGTIRAEWAKKDYSVYVRAGYNADWSSKKSGGAVEGVGKSYDFLVERGEFSNLTQMRQGGPITTWLAVRVDEFVE